MLIENNILSLKGFIFNVKIDYAVIESYRITIFVKAKQKN